MLDRRCCRGSTDAEKALLEFNARNQVTMWGPNLQVKNTHGGTGPGNPQDYAGKTWSGLFGTYYKPRQQLFMDMLQDAAAVAAAAAAPVNISILARLAQTPHHEIRKCTCL